MRLSQPLFCTPTENRQIALMNDNKVPNLIPENTIQSSLTQFNSTDMNIPVIQTNSIPKTQIIQQSIANSTFQADIKARRRFFTQEEDILLTNAAIQYNEKNWANIAKHVPGRTPRQCRDRWMNYLKPNLKFDPWTKEEDALLASLVNSQGTHWAKMVSHFPGRSTNAIKNRWNWLIKDRINPILQSISKNSACTSKEQHFKSSSKPSLNNYENNCENNSLKNIENNVSQQSTKLHLNTTIEENDIKEIQISNSETSNNSSKAASRQIIDENIFAIWQEPLAITFDSEEINW